MTFKIASRVSQTSATTGTGTLSLDASSNPTGYRKFADAIGNANTCPYVIDDGNGNWEEGIGTVTSGTPDTLARTTVKNNSLGTTAKVNFSAGTKTVQITPVAYAAWWWNSVPTTDQIGIANSAGGMDPISIAAYFKKLLTTDGDVAQNVSGTVQRQTVAAMFKTLLTTDGDLALNDSGTVVHSSVSGALKKLLTTDGDIPQNVSGTVSRRTTAQLLTSLDKVRPHFSAYLTSSATNATGDGTQVIPTGYTATTNVGSCFASGAFTAPANGTLLILGAATFGNLGSGHTQGFVSAQRSDAVGFWGAITNAANQKDSSGNWAAPIAQKIHMTSGQTVKFAMTVSNSTKTVTIFGGEGQTQIGGLFIAD